jgi:hypothetical protein
MLPRFGVPSSSFGAGGRFAGGRGARTCAAAMLDNEIKINRIIRGFMAAKL